MYLAERQTTWCQQPQDPAFPSRHYTSLLPEYTLQRCIQRCLNPSLLNTISVQHSKDFLQLNNPPELRHATGNSEYNQHSSLMRDRILRTRIFKCSIPCCHSTDNLGIDVPVYSCWLLLNEFPNLRQNVRNPSNRKHPSVVRERSRLNAIKRRNL
jgi:hypothetical protein